MSQGTAPQKPKTAKAIREDRLKAALKANMGRRKAQARARKAETKTDNGQSGQDTEG
ncbi:hypothetical protein [Sulfitobacter sp. AS59]|jgi:hypothetical protein|uniref:hypothetical protein n=1 Tax=Sulfitobacter sp. AS59 TaxID=3135784 RepID=UPI0030FA217B